MKTRALENMQSKQLRNSDLRVLTRFIILLQVLGLTLAGVGETANASHISSDALGRKLYVGKCAKCHKLYDPAKYSDQQWQVWMDKMSRKAKLQPEQKELLSRYIEGSLRGTRRDSEGKSTVAGSRPSSENPNPPDSLRWQEDQIDANTTRSSSFKPAAGDAVFGTTNPQASPIHGGTRDVLRRGTEP